MLREGASPNARGAYCGVCESCQPGLAAFAYQAPRANAADLDGLAMAVLCMRGDFADFDAVDRRGFAAGHLGRKRLERG